METHTADAVGQVGELLGVVQHFDALGVGIVAHRERLRDGGGKFPAEREELLRLRVPLILYLLGIVPLTGVPQGIILELLLFAWFLLRVKNAGNILGCVYVL